MTSRRIGIGSWWAKDFLTFPEAHDAVFIAEDQYNVAAYGAGYVLRVVPAAIKNAFGHDVTAAGGPRSKAAWARRRKLKTNPQAGEST